MTDPDDATVTRVMNRSALLNHVLQSRDERSRAEPLGSQRRRVRRLEPAVAPHSADSPELTRTMVLDVDEVLQLRSALEGEPIAPPPPPIDESFPIARRHQSLATRSQKARGASSAASKASMALIVALLVGSVAEQVAPEPARLARGVAGRVFAQARGHLLALAGASTQPRGSGEPPDQPAPARPSGSALPQRSKGLQQTTASQSERLEAQPAPPSSVATGERSEGGTTSLAQKPPAGVTLQRQAADALVRGDVAAAAGLFELLARTKPEEPAFSEAARILSATDEMVVY